MKKIMIKLFLITSTIGFWYLILPSHYLTLIAYLCISMIVAIPTLKVIDLIVSTIIWFLRKRYHWARKLFTDPRY